MEYGFSLVLNDYVHAEEVSYEDCKQFIILCPSCQEHVHKVGSEAMKRQYLAHFPLKGKLDCELRVQQIIKERFGAKPSFPRGQELDKLLAQFETIVTEPYRSPNVAEAKGIIRCLNQMRGRHRSSFTRAVENMRPNLRALWQNPDGPFEGKAAVNNPSWCDQSAEWRDCLNTTMGYLTSANAGRAMLFAVCHGFMMSQGIYFAMEKNPEDFPGLKSNEFDYILLMEANNEEFRRYLKELWNTPNHQGLDYLVARFASAIMITGIVFVNRVLSFGNNFTKT